MKWKLLVEEWKNHHSLDEKLRQNLVEIELDEKSLEDAFYTPLEFGTAGMRGVLGAGINRMNIYTVRQKLEKKRKNAGWSLPMIPVTNLLNLLWKSLKL